LVVGDGVKRDRELFIGHRDIAPFDASLEKGTPELASDVTERGYVPLLSRASSIASAIGLCPSMCVKG